MDIQGKVALVTGGGSGIGQATAVRLAREGASIVAVDIDEEGSRQTVQQIESAGGRASSIRGDVSSEEDIRKMIEFAEETYGGLDILHNNAGITTGRPRFPEAEPERWLRVLDVNLRAVILGTHHGIEAMRKRGGGVIINTASMAGLAGFEGDPVYAATKGGVVMFTHSLRYLKDEFNIRVNCVCPGLVDTPLLTRNRDQMPDDARRLLEETMARVPRLAPEDIADAVIELIRDDRLTGQAMRILNGRPRDLAPLPTLQRPG